MTDACSASDGKQLNIEIGHQNFLPKYWNIGQRPFYPNQPFSTDNRFLQPVKNRQSNSDSWCIY